MWVSFFFVKKNVSLFTGPRWLLFYTTNWLKKKKKNWVPKKKSSRYKWDLKNIYTAVIRTKMGTGIRGRSILWKQKRFFAGQAPFSFGGRRRFFLFDPTCGFSFLYKSVCTRPRFWYHRGVLQCICICVRNATFGRSSALLHQHRKCPGRGDRE